MALKEYFRKLLFCFAMQLRKERRGIKRKVRGVKNVNSEEKSSSIYLYGSLYDISKNTVNIKKKIPLVVSLQKETVALASDTTLQRYQALLPSVV